MTFKFVHEENEHTILRVVSGSVAYGLNTSNSDTDVRGVFIQPHKQFYSLSFEEQLNDAKNDIVYYELRKLFDLLLRNNPNMLELLAVPDDCILYKHAIVNRLKPEIFLSKLCYKSFAGYAQMQLQKARGLNKKIVNPMEKERKGLLDFCWLGHGQGSMPLKEWLQAKMINEVDCGCVAIDHMKNCYHLFVGDGYKGITDKDDVQIVLSSTEKTTIPVVTFYCNIEGFQKYCVDYNDYWKWVSNRNQDRYENTVRHGKQYDAKNMMHTFRLLYTAMDIAKEASIVVRRKERKQLLEIRSGLYEYDDLVKRANDTLAEVKVAFEKSTLPDALDKDLANDLLVEIRKTWYTGSWYF